MLESFKYEDLKKLSYEELEALASEIRSRIIDVTSKNGGHLSSNLGVVELTIALHKVFNPPYDKLIFDVSHQTYAHKILTGRNKNFDTLRTYNGLNGFSKLKESPFDAFEAGHSSTSISAGLGFLEAKEALHEDYEVVAIIGDASISNGLCFEALDYLASKKKKKMIIVINDNHMGVGENIGFLANHLSDKTNVFTSLGFKYIDNIDGHDLKALVKAFNDAKKEQSTVVLHVKTIKGKGYEPSEKDQIGLWHGINGFNKETGKINNLESFTFGHVLANELSTLADHDKLIRVITPGMKLGSGLIDFSKKHNELLIDCGIAEENSLIMASSMAQAGLTPVVFMYSTFMQRAYDELLHDIARTNTHVVICLDRAGIVSGDGDTHQGIYDMAYLNSIPGLTIMQPANDNDAKAMLNFALYRLSSPVIIRYPKGLCPKGEKIFDETSRPRVIKLAKKCIISYGPIINDIFNEIKDTNLGLIACPVTTPLDYSYLDSLKIEELIVYENVIKNGSLYSNLVLNLQSKTRIKSYSLPNSFVETGSLDELRNIHGLNIKEIIEKEK